MPNAKCVCLWRTPILRFEMQVIVYMRILESLIYSYAIAIRYFPWFSFLSNLLSIVVSVIFETMYAMRRTRFGWPQLVAICKCMQTNISFRAVALYIHFMFYLLSSMEIWSFSMNDKLDSYLSFQYFSCNYILSICSWVFRIFKLFSNFNTDHSIPLYTVHLKATL